MRVALELETRVPADVLVRESFTNRRRSLKTEKPNLSTLRRHSYCVAI